MQRAFASAMGFPGPTIEYLDCLASDFEPARSLAVFHRGQVVSTAYSYLLELTVPGAHQIDAACVTAVCVLATHRRRRLLSQMMRQQLGDARDRGETLAVLIASESIIYGRFGYGPSSYLVDLEMDTRDGAYRPDVNLVGDVSFVDRLSWSEVAPSVYDRWRRQYPGAIPRTSSWWRSAAAPPQSETDSFLVHEDPSGAVDGFARYSHHSQWSGGMPAGIVEIRDFVAETRDAASSLWRHVLDIDLVRTVRAPARSVDEPLRWWLANPRALRTTRLADFFWTRILDVPAALSERRYATDLDLVLAVEDPLFDSNSRRFALRAHDDDVSCEPTTSKPDLSMSIADLGSIYLGGVTPSDLARAGRITEVRDGALVQADAAFASSPKPWSATTF